VMGLNKGDKVEMNVTYYKYENSIFTVVIPNDYPYIDKKTNKPKKHIDFKDMSDEYERMDIVKID
ncbi:hypothetical protein, partial [Mycobacterium marinum]|uniref:hypothetical protein n=1 Tax=Mycobacterium marinum TaxID=1781 RepID=UPI0035699BB9